MAIKYQSITGTKDIFPPNISIWQYVEKSARDLFHIYDYKEIRTPILESTELFMRSVGTDTDIVEKEMYTLLDKDENSISLRPEETAGVIRAYLENGLYSTQTLWKLYYIGPMFRRERPQAGRFRQFHQIGAELIGSYLPNADCETIIWLVTYFNRLNINDVVLNLNSAGCPKCKPSYLMRLREEIEPKLKNMCADCQRRFKRNIVRLLDCKQEQCRKVISGLPVISEFLCAECAEHFNELRKILDTEGIIYEINPHLVRGIDYYTKTIYEFTHKGLGSQNAIAAGGRYDLLIQEMGGTAAGAIGFSIGEERLVMVLEKKGIISPQDDLIRVYLISLDKESYNYNFKLLNELRRAGISSDIDYEQKTLKAQMRTANKIGVRYAIIRGTEELNKGIVTLKNMQDGSEEKIESGKVVEAVKHKLSNIS